MATDRWCQFLHQNTIRSKQRCLHVKKENWQMHVLAWLQASGVQKQIYNLWFSKWFCLLCLCSFFLSGCFVPVTSSGAALISIQTEQVSGNHHASSLSEALNRKRPPPCLRALLFYLPQRLIILNLKELIFKGWSGWFIKFVARGRSEWVVQLSFQSTCSLTLWAPKRKVWR